MSGKPSIEYQTPRPPPLSPTASLLHCAPALVAAGIYVLGFNDPHLPLTAGILFWIALILAELLAFFWLLKGRSKTLQSKKWHIQLLVASHILVLIVTAGAFVLLFLHVLIARGR